LGAVTSGADADCADFCTQRSGSFWGNPAAKCSLRGFLSLTDASRYKLGVKPIRDCLPAEMIALAVTIRRGHQLHGH
jgi:hypothetical protein